MVVDAAEQDNFAKTLRLTAQKQVGRLDPDSAQMDYRIGRLEQAGP